jgi:enamine deaminase RidA (YjgF/YER057c/UK114 family)
MLRRLAARSCSTKVLITRVPMGPSTNWGDSAGVSRAVRIADTIHISGTVTKGESTGAQLSGCLAIIADAVRSAGGRGLQDVVLTRIIAADPAKDLVEIAAAHKAAFADAGAEWPANTTFGGSFPRPWIRVGVEATAVVQSEPTQAPPPPPPQTPTSFEGVDISAYSRATVANRSRPDPPAPRR